MKENNNNNNNNNIGVNTQTFLFFAKTKSGELRMKRQLSCECFKDNEYI